MFILYYIISIIVAAYATYYMFKEDGHIELGVLTTIIFLSLIPIINNMVVMMVIAARVDWDRKIYAKEKD